MGALVGADDKLGGILGSLGDREIDLEGALLLERLVAYVAHHPNHTDVVIQDAHHLADGVLAAEQNAGRFLVQHHNPLGRGGIPLGQVPSRDQRYPHGRQVAMIDHAWMRDGILSGGILHTSNTDAPASIAAKG
jgi:hypothetical protein